MAKPFKPLTNLFPCVPPVVNRFLTRAIANIKPSCPWLAIQVVAVEIPVATPRVVVGIFDLRGVSTTGKSCQWLLKTQY